MLLSPSSETMTNMRGFRDAIFDLVKTPICCYTINWPLWYWPVSTDQSSSNKWPLSSSNQYRLP